MRDRLEELDRQALLALESPYARLPIREEADVVIARKLSRELALQQGLPESAIAALATAISEIAWKIVVHAGAGQILVAGIEGPGESR